jgi:hypothetical protein
MAPAPLPAPGEGATAPVLRPPAYSLWVGGHAGALAYGGALYRIPSTGKVETAGNFVDPGGALEIDVGARLAGHFIPYAALELGLVAAGHRFDGTDAQANTKFLGIGLRYVAGQYEHLGFVGDVSMGYRWFQVWRAAGTWTAWGLELLRLNLAVDVRLQRRMTLSPMLLVSAGTVTNTSGTVPFAPEQGDGQTAPAFGGTAVPSSAQEMYYAVSLGCGIHADLLGP